MSDKLKFSLKIFKTVIALKDFYHHHIILKVATYEGKQVQTQRKNV